MSIDVSLVNCSGSDSDERDHFKDRAIHIFKSNVAVGSRTYHFATVCIDDIYKAIELSLGYTYNRQEFRCCIELK